MKAVFPGSFDPPTLGHINLIERLTGIFSELLIVIAENRQKKYLFSTKEREAMLKTLTASFPNASVFVWDSLIADFMRRYEAKVLARGVRGSSDFSYEFELSLMYKTIDPHIETIFIPTDPKYFTIRSSSIKELASFGGDVSSMAPPLVVSALKEKFSPRSPLDFSHAM